MNADFDLIIIGGGSAGYAAARTGVQEGLKVAVVDGAEELGGLCILRGCMPSKALIASANVNRTVRRAEIFGIQAQAVGPVMEAMVARKRKWIGEFKEYRQQQLEGGAFELVRGWASFVSSHKVKVVLREGGECHLTGRTFLIATGSRHQLPALEGLESTPYWTSDEVLNSTERPESIIILGGGAIALEFAHYYEALGTQVTLLQRSNHLLSRFDPEIGKTVQNAFEKRGIHVRTGCGLQSVNSTSTRVEVVLKDAEGETHTEHAARLLVALGRVPETHRLGLEAIGVHCDRGRVQVTPHQSTTKEHIFAAGDVCGPADVVHVAIQQGETAARNAARIVRGESVEETVDHRLRLVGIFCEPQVACVGCGEAEAREAGLAVRVARHSFSDHGKSLLMEEDEGFVKLIVDHGSGEILGGAAVGPEATELIHEVAVAMFFRATARDLLCVPHYHPTLSEIWTYPAEELAVTK